MLWEIICHLVLLPVSPRGLFNTVVRITMCCHDPACFWYHGQRAHYIITLCKNINVYNFETVFSPLKSKAESPWKTGMNDYKASSIKSKVNLPLKIAKFVSRSVRAFNFLPQITTFTIFIWTFSKIKIKLPILR